MDSGEPKAGETAREPLLREWRCVACGRVTAFRVEAGTALPRIGPPCNRCDEVTRLVALDGEPAHESDEWRALGDRPAVADPPAASPVAATQRSRPARAAAGADAPLPPPRRRYWRPLLILTEFWYARRASQHLLGLYRVVRQQQPGQTDRERYEELVVRWRGLDRCAARAILHRAEQSFSDWDSERDLKLRDVVLYVVTDEYIRDHPERHGARSRMARTIARAVPRSL